MHFNAPSMAVIVLFGIGILVSAPVLIKGFTRRGKGVKYEQNFLIQRAPQLMSGVTFLTIVASYLTYNNVPGFANLKPVFALTNDLPSGVILVISWFGVALLVSGLIFMIGGWYSLGEFFSTDAEVMDNHKVRDTGLLSFVMHPAYSGIIQSLLGASIAATSPIAALLTVGVVAPLWLRRAKYEEKMLIEALGQSYKDYAENMKWRRLVPRFFPIGV